MHSSGHLELHLQTGGSLDLLSPVSFCRALRLISTFGKGARRISKMDKLSEDSTYIQTASWLRLVLITLVSALICDLLVKKLIATIRLRNQVDKLPGPPVRNLLLGNIPLEVLSLLTNRSKKKAGDFYTSQIQSVLGHTLIYKDESLFRLWIGDKPVICVWKPEIIESVLGDNSLLEKSYHYDFLRPWLGNGLLTSPGRVWRPRRKLLVPSFHFHILQAFVPVFDRKSKLMVRNITKKINASIESIGGGEDSSTVVDITPVITACTLDAICETIMGVSIDAQENPNNDYCQSIYIVGETFLERIIQPRYWLDFVFRRTELGKLYNYHLDKLHSFTRKVIADKKIALFGSLDNRSLNSQDNDDKDCLRNRVKVMEKTSIDSFLETNKDAPKLPKAFLDLLLDKVNLPGGLKLTDEEVREEVDTFMFEGHDTTAMALSWTIFLLGHHREVQQKLQQEVDELFALMSDEDEDHLELDHLKKLKYLDCVIKEALRLCPSVPFIGRETRTELSLGGYKIPPRSVIFVLIYQLHRNCEIYPNPELFDPDRFLPKNSLGRHPFAYVPFSAGPRNCIGQKFAMAEMKTILLHLVRNFTFESVTPIDRARVQMEMVLRPKCPLEVRIRRRMAGSC